MCTQQNLKLESPLYLRKGFLILKLWYHELEPLKDLILHDHLQKPKTTFYKREK